MTLEERADSVCKVLFSDSFRNTPAAKAGEAAVLLALTIRERGS